MQTIKNHIDCRVVAKKCHQISTDQRNKDINLENKGKYKTKVFMRADDFKSLPSFGSVNAPNINNLLLYMVYSGGVSVLREIL